MELVGGILWEASLMGEVAQESWQIFKNSVLQMKGWSILVLRSEEIYQEPSLAKKGTHTSAWKQKEIIQEVKAASGCKGGI